MQVFNAKQYLDKANPSLALTHAFNLLQQVKQLTSWAVVHDKNIELISFNKLMGFYKILRIQSQADLFLVLQ